MDKNVKKIREREMDVLSEKKATLFPSSSSFILEGKISFSHSKTPKSLVTLTLSKPKIQGFVYQRRMKKSVVNTPKKKSVVQRVLFTPLKRSYSSNPTAERNKMQKKNLVEKEEVDKEETWVTVFGFSQSDIKSVLREFEKCGRILEHVAGPHHSNWVHILYQKRSDAQIALRKSDMIGNRDVILGVKLVDPIWIRDLKEMRKFASEPPRKPKVVDPARIEHALNQWLSLLHRSEADFFLMTEFGFVFTVTLSRIPSCNCPDWRTPCEHMIFVLLRVLKISRDDDCLHSETLTQCQVERLLNMPSSLKTFAEPPVCKSFRHLLSTMSNVGPPQKIQLGIGEECRYCNVDLNEDTDDPVAECAYCLAVGHESCLVTSEMRREGDNCKSCRRHWRAKTDETRYLNVEAYDTFDTESSDSDDEDSEDSQGVSSGEDEDEGEDDSDDDDDN